MERPGYPAAAYVYSEDRKGARPAGHLAGFSGVLQVDGYAGCLHRACLEQFRKPLKLSDVVGSLGPDSTYAAVFPGGHGPLAGLPSSLDVAAVIRWAFAIDRYIIAICHGPAAFLACAVDGDSFPFTGYSITAFPDANDRTIPDVGYMPGQLTLHFGEKLTQLGVRILNTEPDESTYGGESPATHPQAPRRNQHGTSHAPNRPCRQSCGLSQTFAASSSIAFRLGLTAWSGRKETGRYGACRAKMLPFA